MTKTNGSAGNRSLADALAHRLGKEFSDRERALIDQLIHEFPDEAPENLRPEPRVVTVLMADLRGFSALAASTDPETLVTMLQPFFTRMTEVIHEHGGFVDKFLGDGIMALFGAPAPCENHLQNALACAARMQCAMDSLNAGNAALGLQPLYVGIGINSGEVMAGSFGSHDYREYTVIGDVVNLAARMEKFALRGEVLFSEHCLSTISESVEVAATRQLRVRGHRGPITLHALGAITGTDSGRVAVPNVEVRSSPRVPVDLPLLYQTVEDQRVMPMEREGSIVNLGYDGMLAQLPLPLPSMGEITFALAPEPTALKYEDLYARALHQRETDDGYQTAFTFTSVGTHGREAVRRYVDQMLWGP